MSRDRLGRCQVLSLPHSYAIRGLYGPLHLAMAQNDADRVGTPSTAGRQRWMSTTSQ